MVWLSSCKLPSLQSKKSIAKYREHYYFTESTIACMHVAYKGIMTFRPSSVLSSMSPSSKSLFPLESLTSLLNTAEKSIIRAGHLYEIVLDQIRGSRIHESCTSQRKPAIQQAQRTNDIEIPVIHDSRRGAVSRFCPLLNAIWYYLSCHAAVARGTGRDKNAEIAVQCRLCLLIRNCPE